MTCVVRMPVGQYAPDGCFPDIGAKAACAILNLFFHDYYIVSEIFIMIQNYVFLVSYCNQLPLGNQKLHNEEERA